MFADKSLARLTSRYRRTESIVSLEREVCSCAELQVFSCYRGWNETCQATCGISTTWRRELSSSFIFLARPGAEGNSRHSDWNVKGNMHHRIPPSKTGWPTFNVVIFPSVMRLVLEDNPGDYWSNSRTNLENFRISAKSTAKQLGISCERVWSIIYEDLDMRNLSAKWVPKCPNADQRRQSCQSSEQRLKILWGDPNYFLWPWMKPGYINMTRRQGNNQCSGGIAAHLVLKYSECKNSLENFSSRFIGIKTAPSSFIIFQMVTLTTPNVIYLFWRSWRIFWRKNATGRSPRASCSCTTISRLTGNF